MSLVLVAHGTRKQSGVAMVGDLAQRVSATLGQTVHVSFVDVLGPTPSEVLAPMAEPAIVVPAFLSRGYHVTADIPAHVESSRHSDVTVTEALGPGPQLVRVLADRLMESGWRQGDSVILAAAGTSDPNAQRDLHTMATGCPRSRVHGSSWRSPPPEHLASMKRSRRCASGALVGSWWRRICCRRACFRTGCGQVAPTW
jgi:sirohydrochlorin ferrochelatase